MRKPDPKPYDVEVLGQVFTPESIVDKMLGLRRNNDPEATVLEPSCGDGAFFRKLPGAVGIEIDAEHCPVDALNMDFFDFATQKKFDVILGNPPFVKFRDIHPRTRPKLNLDRFDERTNLYVFFIDRCLDMLADGGEIIFINPRDFLKSTSARRLNARLVEEGTITHIEDLGDAPVFPGYAPNCVIWRFEKGNMTHRTEDGRRVVFHEGQISFLRGEYPYRVSDIFDVKVGGVSGKDTLFTADAGTCGAREFVCSTTIDTGVGRWMIYADESPTPPHGLVKHREELKARKIRSFSEENWWHWGRRPPVDARRRVYVNAKTRREKPFFLHTSPWFDGSVLGLMIKDSRLDEEALCAALNAVDWEELGFKSGGRYLFSQRSLMNARLPANFGKFLMPETVAAE